MKKYKQLNLFENEYYERTFANYTNVSRETKTIWKQSLWNEGIFYIQDELGYTTRYTKPGKKLGVQIWKIKCLYQAI